MDVVEVCNFWNRSVEKLLTKWSEFTGGIIAGLAEEEMRMRCEELNKQIETRNEHAESQGAVEA